MQKPPKKPLVHTPKFQRWMGMFQTSWSSLELTTDYAIGVFLSLPAQEAHLITSGLMFGRKSRLLAALIARSDHPNKNAILGAFNKVRGVSKRDVFAHSYLRSDYDSVTFLERSEGGEFKATEHTFTYDSFRAHVAAFILAVDGFFNALAPDYDDVQKFAHAALSLNRKSKTSPDAPKSNA